MRRSLLLFSIALATLAATACSDDSDGSRGGTSGPNGPTQTAPAEPPEEGTGANLAQASVQLAPVVDLESATALATRARDDRLWVTEQTGIVRVVQDGTAETVLDLTDRVTASGNEQGLLGIAFAPDGETLYLDYTRIEDGETEVVAFAMDGDAPDPDSFRTILRVGQPQANHNGGQLAFGPDGLLYIGRGDGGGAGDVGPGHIDGGNAQSLETLLGKILRIDPTPNGDEPYRIPPDNPFVAGPQGALPEIWSYGLRNPWRFSFDADTGDLWIGDVGQNTIEEIDFAAAATGGGAGVNFGWNEFEGTNVFSGDEPPPNAQSPIFEFDRSQGACSVTGGYVYRGDAIPALQGAYLFSDYCDGRIRALVQENGAVVAERDLGIETSEVTTFGEGPDRELYVVSRGEGLFRIVPA
jgi:glucose/arabinose dehydrogenase